MSSDKLPCFLDEKLRRVDAFELEEPNLCTTCCCSTLVPSPVSSPRARSTGSTSFRGTWSCSASRPGTSTLASAWRWTATRRYPTRDAARTRRRYVEPSRRLTSPPCVCSRGTNHMPNVRQAPVPSEPHPHHLILCTVLYMFMCVTVRSKSLSWAACVDKLA